MSKKLLIILLIPIFIVVGLVGGCDVYTHLNNSERLMKHPEFEIARGVAPNFTADALHTINELEYIIERGIKYHDSGKSSGSLQSN